MSKAALAFVSRVRSDVELQQQLAEFRVEQWADTHLPLDSTLMPSSPLRLTPVFTSIIQMWSFVSAVTLKVLLPSRWKMPSWPAVIWPGSRSRLIGSERRRSHSATTGVDIPPHQKHFPQRAGLLLSGLAC